MYREGTLWKRRVVGVLAAGLMTSGCYDTEDLNTGVTNRLEAWLDGSGLPQAQGLRAVDVDIVSAGSGHVAAFVDGGGVVISLDSSGSVDLFGHALSTQVRVDGSGQVIWH